MKTVHFDEKDLSRVEITAEEIKEALTYPSDFGYSGDNEELYYPLKTWTHGPVFRTRDSDLLEESNADCLIASLKAAVESGEINEDDFEVFGASHWAVGWVDHLAFRIVEDDGTTPTKTAIWIKAWFDMLADYPVADEEDFSSREYEYALQSISDTLRWNSERAELRDGVDSCEASEAIRSHLCEHGSGELPTENHSMESYVLAAARELGFLEEKDEDE